MFCRSHDFSKSRFDDRTVMICDQPLPELNTDIIKKKLENKGVNVDADVDIRWRLLSHLLYQQEFYVFWEVRLQNYRWLQQAGNTKGR
ncbi:hypothetical protein BHE74_00009115 [Ensete ventricosum]|nr:hypothetical protein GW17_00023136 [Ensete ventricosum]RWW82439.1 hypothetical protein BHE74_00009115 [Ensete ventricosum]RZR79499.1 hypothetical protein BHM03_00005229 [Ensete ventricosum]